MKFADLKPGDRFICGSEADSSSQYSLYIKLLIPVRHFKVNIIYTAVSSMTGAPTVIADNESVIKIMEKEV
jgi:hypothetical protein